MMPIDFQIELTQYLKENLRIEIKKSEESYYGGDYKASYKVILMLGDDEISTDYID